MKNVIIFGNVPLATWVTKQILKSNHINLIGLVCDNYAKDFFSNHGMDEGSLYSYCKENSLEILSFDKAYEIAKYTKVLGISVRFHKLFTQDYFSVFNPGIINLHGGELPRFRGANIANYAILENVSRGGGTLHFISKGIDEGDIVEREFFEVTENDTAILFFKKSLKALQSAFLNFLVLIDVPVDVSIKRIPQQIFIKDGEYVKTYYKKGIEKFRYIECDNLNWDKIYRHVRAFHFPGHQGASLVNGDNRIELTLTFKNEV